MMKLNVPIGMKHFIQMIMMMNLAIHTIVVPLKAAVPHLTKSHRVMYKRIKIEKYPQKGRTKILSLKKRMKLVKKMGN